MQQTKITTLAAGLLLSLLASASASAVQADGMHARGEDVKTPTTSCAATTTCATPDPTQTTGYPDYDLFCKCPPYSPDSPPGGNPYLGLVRCDTKCSPADPTQTRVVPQNGSLSECMSACTGSFEKDKKKTRRGALEARQDDPDYWFCHGVNFVEGQLCEFIGSIGSREFVAGGSDCLYIDGLDG